MKQHAENEPSEDVEIESVTMRSLGTIVENLFCHITIYSTIFQEAFTLLNVINLGGLQAPADGFITILMLAERNEMDISLTSHINRLCVL